MWFYTALLSALALTGQLYCFQRLQKHYPIDAYLFICWLSTAILLPVLYPPSSFVIHLKFWTWIAILSAGIASWIGNYTYNVSINKQINVGYVEALSSTRIIGAFFLSFAFLAGEFDWVKFLAIIGVVVGVFLVSGSSLRKKQGSDQKDWRVWALYSGAAFSVLAACSKYVFNQGVDFIIGTSLILIIASCIFGISLSKRRQLKSLFRPSKPYLLLLAIVFATIGNGALFYSYSVTPNLGYTTAISSSRMIFLTLISTKMNGAQFDFLKFAGVVLAFISIVFLA